MLFQYLLQIFPQMVSSYRYIYYLISILESSISFFILYDHVTCDCDICDHPVTCVTFPSHMISHHTSLSKSSLFFYFFLNQQFVTQHMVVDHGSYFITTYNRSKLHEEMETEEREREKRYKELIEEIEKKGKRNGEIREF